MDAVGEWGSLTPMDILREGNGESLLTWIYIFNFFLHFDVGCVVLLVHVCFYDFCNAFDVWGIPVFDACKHCDVFPLI